MKRLIFNFRRFFSFGIRLKGVAHAPYAPPPLHGYAPTIFRKSILPLYCNLNTLDTEAQIIFYNATDMIMDSFGLK